ncbi:MAG: magnesium chelatase subunit D family protein [Deltaproteobacteria bacterium]|nr:magnesium chelatase subunit D family protein [Deltaproteobacteria bacterium]
MKPKKFTRGFPFSAVVGQEAIKTALILNVIDPGLGGVLIRGERGTAKSTIVRGLADLLPQIRVVEGCPFNCHPDDEGLMCPGCHARFEKEGAPLPYYERAMTVVNLPIGTTEDRLLGSLDIEAAIHKGRKRFEPGLLAEVNRGIFYVDEVNLLNDHLVDLLLDVAAMGVNVVEREGISFSHHSRFTLVGTMNPEEGDLRPQLLDRFGLCVDVTGIADREPRMEIVTRRLDFEADPQVFRGQYQEADQTLARRIVSAREFLPLVKTTGPAISLAASIALAMGVEGHRADVAMVKTAKALCAYKRMPEITPADIKLAAEFVLPHRIKQDGLIPKKFSAQKMKRAIDRISPPDTPESPPEIPGTQDTPILEGDLKKNLNLPPEIDVTTTVQPLLDPAKVELGRLFFNLVIPKAGLGRRRGAPPVAKLGHYVRAMTPHDRVTDLALDATIRAAAPFQSQRERNGGIVIFPEDVREKIREHRAGHVIVLVVDSSGSMRSDGRGGSPMSTAKGLMGGLVKNLRLRRDKLALVIFRHLKAELLLPFTRDGAVALEAVEGIPTGGKTPLGAGLRLGFNMLIREKRKTPDISPLMVIVSDGRANLSIDGEDPLEDALMWSQMIAKNNISSIFIDTQSHHLAFGYGPDISKALTAKYFRLDQLIQEMG